MNKRIMITLIVVFGATSLVAAIAAVGVVVFVLGAGRADEGSEAKGGLPLPEASEQSKVTGHTEERERLLDAIIDGLWSRQETARFVSDLRRTRPDAPTKKQLIASMNTAIETKGKPILRRRLRRASTAQLRELRDMMAEGRPPEQFVQAAADVLIEAMLEQFNKDIGDAPTDTNPRTSRSHDRNAIIEDIIVNVDEFMVTFYPDIAREFTSSNVGEGASRRIINFVKESYQNHGKRMLQAWLREKSTNELVALREQLAAGDVPERLINYISEMITHAMSAQAKQNQAGRAGR